MTSYSIYRYRGYASIYATLLRGNKLLPRIVIHRYIGYAYIYATLILTVCCRLSGRESWLTLFTFLTRFTFLFRFTFLIPFTFLVQFTFLELVDLSDPIYLWTRWSITFLVGFPFCSVRVSFLFTCVCPVPSYYGLRPRPHSGQWSHCVLLSRKALRSMSPSAPWICHLMMLLLKV